MSHCTPEHSGPRDTLSGGDSGEAKRNSVTPDPPVSPPTHCPNCPDQGWYVVANRQTGEPEQEQCEWCHTTPNSYFNICRQLENMTQRLTAVHRALDGVGKWEDGPVEKIKSLRRQLEGSYLRTLLIHLVCSNHGYDFEKCDACKDIRGVIQKRL